MGTASRLGGLAAAALPLFAACKTGIEPAVFAAEVERERSACADRVRVVDAERVRAQRSRDEVEASARTYRLESQERVERLEATIAGLYAAAHLARTAGPRAVDADTARALERARAAVGGVARGGWVVRSMPLELAFPAAGERPTAALQTVLSAVAKAIASSPTLALDVVVELADDAGAAEARGLAQRRGLAIHERLVELGLSPARLALVARPPSPGRAPAVHLEIGGLAAREP